ncbi:MAG: phosphate-selective porin OprO/OprP [Myxococcota bacterium]
MFTLVLFATCFAVAADEPSPLVPQSEADNYTKHPVDFQGAYYKPGKGLTIASKDGRFSTAIGLRAMYLYELEHDPNAQAPDPMTTQEVMIRRARITFVGHMWGEHNTYKVELAVSPRDEAVDDDGDVTQTPLLTWENTFTHLRDAELRIGQYKIPFTRERVVSSSKLAMVDRSAHNKEFNLDRDIGLDVRSGDLGGLGMLQYNLGVYAGEGRGRFEPTDLGVMYLARFNVTPLGLFDDYEPQDFERVGPRLSVGAAYAFINRAQGANDIQDGGPEGAEYGTHNLTADLLFKAYGFSTEAAWAMRGGGDDALRPFLELGSGFYVQPGYLLPGLPIGINARYGQNTPAADSAMSANTEVGPGLSWYIAGARNKLKLQADYLRAWGSDGPSTAKQGARVQLQAML